MRPHILVVDDDPTILEILSRQLGEYQVSVASSGEEALEKVREICPPNGQNGLDLVIADVRMPGMDGVELLEQVKKLRPDVPRFILTGYTDAHAQQAADCPDGVYKFSKPWGEELIVAVRRALEGLEATRTLRRRLSLVLGWLELPSDLCACGGLEEILATLGRWLENLDGVKQAACYVVRHAKLECVHSSGRGADVSLYQTDNPLVRCITEGTVIPTCRGNRIESARCLGSPEARGVVHLSLREGDAETSCLVDHALAVAALALRGGAGTVVDETPPEQAKLGRLQQLATLGRLLAVVVHETASSLSAMRALLETLQTNLGANRSAAGHLNVLTTELGRIADMLECAGQATRPPASQFTRVGLCQTIISTISLVGHHYRTHGVLITIELPGSDVFVTGSASRLQQMWLNLLNNAFDAVTAEAPEEGSIVISVEHKTSEDPGVGQAGHIEVTIADNGAGMTPEVLKRIQTNPDFFTTRPDGVGLGVCESRRIITEHGGTLEYSSRPGKGTTATIRISAGRQV